MATNNSANFSNPITVAQGGTSASTLTNHSLLVGNSTSAPNFVSVGASSTILKGTTSSDPSFTATPAVTSISFDGTHNLDTYVTTTSWTPILSFGGASVGITYSAHSATYTHIGSLVFIQINMFLSSKGSSTGTMSISGFPFTSVYDVSLTPYRGGVFTYASGQIIGKIAAGGSAIVLQNIVSGGAATTLADTNFANNSFFNIEGFCFV